MGMHDHTLIAGSKTQVLWARAVLAVCDASLANRVSHTDTSACAPLALAPVLGFLSSTLLPLFFLGSHQMVVQKGYPCC